MRSSLFLAAMLTLCLISIAGVAVATDQVYGAGVSAPDTVLVSELLANPDSYVNQVVRVAGTAVAVCQHRGCWVNIASDVEGETVRLKVTDGEIVFPPEILGETVTAEGVWTKFDLDMETTKRVCEHRAQEAGEKFDPDSVTECMTVWQITGTGAVVQEAAHHDHDDHDNEHGQDHDGHDHDHGHGHE